MKKIKWTILIPIITVGFAASIFWISTTNSNDKKLEKWYDNLKKSNVEVRGQEVTTQHNRDDEVIVTKINNDYELKLLLNPHLNIDEETYIWKFNNSFINNVNNLNLKYKTVETSQILPVVWFYFHTEQERKDFALALMNRKEIYKFIVFENNGANQEVTDGKKHLLEKARETTVDIPKDLTQAKIRKIYNYYIEKYSKSVNNNIEIVNAQNWLKNTNSNKIGVLESWSYSFDNDYSVLFDNGIDIKESNGKTNAKDKTHSTMVPMIIGGEYGIDRSSKIYLRTFKNTGKNSDWMKSIEEMVLKKGIRIINHSYGPRMEDKNGIRYKSYDIGYDENSYFLDYIARKYGVINVISAGNDGKKSDHLITNTKLSFNSVIVGALNNYSSKENLKKNIVAEYSNFKLAKDYKEFAKPLVVAPAYFYNPVYDTNEYYNGTSYAAPVVTGLISNLLKFKPNIKAGSSVVPIIKAILSASSISPKLDNLNYKSSGYAEKYGSGTVNFMSMLSAADNYKVMNIETIDPKGFIYTSEKISLLTNDTIKVASSWLFNAGLLAERDPNDFYTNKSYWWNNNTLRSYLNKWTIPEIITTYEVDKYLKDKKMSYSELLKKQNGNLFTDYNLILERETTDGTWEQVKSIDSVVSNDELLEYKVQAPGNYRYRIYKNTNFTYSNSSIDVIAFTHHVWRDND